jgi:hypothetical protein
MITGEDYVAKKKSFARFENIEKTINRIVNEALYDQEKVKGLWKDRKTLTINQHMDIFQEDPKKFEEIKEALVAGKKEFRDWSDNLRFRTFTQLIGTREALAAGLEFTLANSYDLFTDEPEDEDDDDQEENEESYSAYDDGDDYDFSIADTEPATTRIEYTGDIY